MQTGSNTANAPMLRRYLLGALGDEEQTALEESLFSATGHWEDLAVAEEELIDEYVRDELSPADRGRFETAFLTSPRRVERVAFARSLMTKADASAPRLQPSGSRSPERSGSWFAWLWSPNPAVAFAFTAAAIVLIAGGAVGLFTISSRLSAQREETGRIRQQLEALRSQPPAGKDDLLAQVRKELDARVPMSFVLKPGLERGAVTGEQRVTIPPDAGSVRLVLPLSPGKKYVSFRVVVQNADGVEVWGGSGRLGADRGLDVELPAAALKAGVYRSLITGVRADGVGEELEDYYVFRVVGR